MDLWILTLKLGLVLIGVLLMLPGAWPSRDRLFFVAVSPEIHSGEIGTRIRRIYLWSIGAITVLALALGATMLTSVQTQLFQTRMATGLAVFMLLGGGAALALCRNLALDYRFEDDVRRRTATATHDPRRLPRPPGIHFLPYLAPLIVLLLLAIGWERIAELFIYRPAPEGEDWILVERHPLVVFATPVTVLLMLGLCHLLMAISQEIRTPDAWAGRIRAMNLMVLLCMMVISLHGSLIALVPLTGGQWLAEWQGDALNRTALILLILAPLAMASLRFHRRHFSGLADRSPSQSWLLGTLYYNPADPRLSAPHPKIPVYASLNFARGPIWVLVALLLVGLILVAHWSGAA